jgi:uncharacterized protein
MSSPSTDRSPDGRGDCAKSNQAPGTKARLFAASRFVLFALVIGAFLFCLRVGLSKVPVVRSLLKSADAGVTSPSLLWSVDSIGFAAVLTYSAIAAKLERRPLGAYGLPLRGTYQKLFVQGILWGLALAFVVIGLIWMLGGFSFGSVALGPGEALKYAFAWGGAFVLVGLFEEYLFRGYALYTLSISTGFWPAAVLLAAIFGGLHLQNAGEGLVGALDVVIYALFASFTLRRTGSLWFAIGVHAAWDFSLTFLYSVPGSGLKSRGVLLHSVLHGSTWLTGGSAGPEGSAVGLAVLIAAFAFSKFMPRKA